MIESTLPVFPQTLEDYTGITERRLFAAMAMQGFCAHTDIAERTAQQISAWAVEQADALIAELNKEHSND